MRLIQYLDSDKDLQVGIVKDDSQILPFVDAFSMYELAWKAIDNDTGLEQIVAQLPTSSPLSYEQLIQEKRIALPCSHADPAHVMVSGTGLTHLGSASTRDSMHKVEVEKMTDSMRMFQEGIQGGKPPEGSRGVQPEWFFKGDGSCLVPAEQVLTSPSFGLDYGEEPEIVGIYLIGPAGQPYRLGFALGNEASDHITEKQNYLLLAHSKLRRCSIGPELILGDFPAEIRGMSRILRDGDVLWEKEFLSGSSHMSHSLENLEYHHFKYQSFRRSGDVHIHFFGTATLSVSDGIKVKHGDELEISAKGWGRALRNIVQWEESEILLPKSL
ncbi:MAG: AraD1 family protein [Bacteroidota bacterium]